MPLIARLACLAMVPYLLSNGAPSRERFSFSISAQGLNVVLARSGTASN